MNSSRIGPPRSDVLRCLQCRSNDRLVSVPAAVRAGHSACVVRGNVTGPFGYEVPIDSRVLQVGGLARALASPKRPRTVRWPAIAFGGSVLIALWNLQLAMLGSAGARAWFVLVLAAVAAGSGWVLRGRLLHRQAMGPLLGDAIKLWQWSWYCHRCGVVSIYGPGTPTITAVSDFASALVAEARQRRQD